MHVIPPSPPFRKFLSTLPSLYSPFLRPSSFSPSLTQSLSPFLLPPSLRQTLLFDFAPPEASSFHTSFLLFPVISSLLKPLRHPSSSFSFLHPLGQFLPPQPLLLKASLPAAPPPFLQLLLQPLPPYSLIFSVDACDRVGGWRWPLLFILAGLCVCTVMAGCEVLPAFCVQTTHSRAPPRTTLCEQAGVAVRTPLPHSVEDLR